MGFVLAALSWELKMGFPSFLLSFFIVSHLLVLHSSASSCPSSFDCGALPQIKFPFTNTTDPKCGLCTLSCHEQVLTVVFGDEGTPYQVMGIDDHTITINNPMLKKGIDSHSCDIFSDFFNPLTTTPFISFTFSPNLTFIKCSTSNFGHENAIDKYFSGNYTPYRGEGKGCRGYIVYYSYPNNTIPTEGSIPPNCASFQLPIVSSVEGRNLSDPFSLLTSDFSVEYHPSKKCNECLDDGGMCPRHNGEFYCLNETGGKNRINGRKKLALILGTEMEDYFSSYTIWRYTSSDHLSRGGLEEGSAFFGIPIFSYSELNEATHNFDPSKELGDGGFGTVYHGKLQDGREVAVKRLYQHNYKRVAQFLNEIEILTQLRHPNLVTLYGCTSRHSRELLLVYEYIPNGTVADHLHSDRAKDHPLPWPIRMNIAIETASALVYLHASEIIHRDVKTNNILLDNNFRVKVADFGLSRLFPTDVSHVSTAPQGTPGYVDPDYCQCYQLTDKSDVYSFGVVLIELISSLPAVDISRHRHEINLANLAISRIQNGAFNELIDPSLGINSDSSVERMTTSVAEVAFRCLQLEKEMRPRMTEVLEALKEIQEYKDDEIGEMPPPSPDGDNAELQNRGKVPPSQDSVTNGWFSSSTASISSV